MSFALYREVTNPTGVDHALRASFTDGGHINLILIKRHVFEVYRLLDERERPTNAKQQEQEPLLKLMMSVKLFGKVESIAAVQFVGASRQSLVLTFLDAKIGMKKTKQTNEQNNNNNRKKNAITKLTSLSILFYFLFFFFFFF
jgi:hypothetical protein